ncbi:MAG: META domain-containing protein [Sulfitobacter sp.]|nr:META domain-containing protein [Sulfitobacter sp.]
MLTHLFFVAFYLWGVNGTDETLSGYAAGAPGWELIELQGEPFDGAVTLDFPAAGEIAGKAPCNRYSATLRVPYPWFRAGPVIATRMACPDMETEAAFLRALEAATYSEVTGDRLILSDDTGVLLVFKVAD